MVALSQDQIERIEEEQEELGLTDDEVELVKRKKALYNPLGNKKGEECPACGDTECIKAIATIGEGNKIHAEDHPEYKNERARGNRRGF